VTPPRKRRGPSQEVTELEAAARALANASSEDDSEYQSARERLRLAAEALGRARGDDRE
jgi:hypothetical protein